MERLSDFAASGEARSTLGIMWGRADDLGGAGMKAANPSGPDCCCTRFPARPIPSPPPSSESRRRAIDRGSMSKNMRLHFDSIRRNQTIVVHGAKDTNVPVIEAKQVVNSLEARGVPVEYVLFRDEGHGWRRTPNRIRSTVPIVQWFDTHLNQR